MKIKEIIKEILELVLLFIVGFFVSFCITYTIKSLHDRAKDEREYEDNGSVWYCDYRTKNLSFLNSISILSK